jgi:hypothetical protein
MAAWGLSECATMSTPSRHTDLCAGTLVHSCQSAPLKCSRVFTSWDRRLSQAKNAADEPFERKIMTFLIVRQEDREASRRATRRRIVEEHDVAGPE